MAGAWTVVVVGAGLGQHSERAAVGTMPQFHDVPGVKHVRGGDPASAQIEQAQPGTPFALAADGVVAVQGATRVQFGGFILGEQSGQVGVGEWQVVDDALRESWSTRSPWRRRV